MNDTPPVNPRQGNLGQIDWGRPTQQDKIDLTKNLTDCALTKAQEVATPIIEQANDTPPVNPRQGNLGQIDWGRPTQQGKIDLTKNLTDCALTKAQEVATPIIEQAAANKYPNTPRETIQATVGFALTQVKNQT